jgi:hypothetical protein
MKELVRLIDGDANVAQRSLLEAAQAHHPPDDQARARTLAALTAATGGVAAGSLAVAVTSGKSLGAGGALVRALSPAILKWCAVVTVGSGVSVSAVLVVRHEMAAESTSVGVAAPTSRARGGFASPLHSVIAPAPDLALPLAAPTPAVTAIVQSVPEVPSTAGAPFGIAPASERGPEPLPAPAVAAAPAPLPVASRPTTLRSSDSPDPAPYVASPAAPTIAASPTIPLAATAATTASGPQPAPDVAPLSPEVLVLDEARAHLSSHDPASALLALDRYAAAFPRGVFLPEARVLRIEALFAAGDRTSATRLADDFLRGDPNGPYAQRVRKMIQK